MPNALEQYLEQKIADIDRQKDLKAMISRGRFSFEMDSTTYGHLAGWAELVRQKKMLVKWIWVDAVFLAVSVVFFIGEYWDRFAENWWKAILSLLAVAAIPTLLYVLLAFYNLFVKFRMVDQQARKLIYQDILHRLQQEKQTISA